jgi:Uma2 family endonuclease
MRLDVPAGYVDPSVRIVHSLRMSSYSGRPHDPVTADELRHMPDDGWRYELLRGRLLREPPAGAEHSWLGVTLAARLRDFVHAGELGFVFGADCGFRITTDPDTVRAPDVAFVIGDRLPGGPPRGYVPFAPDLAVEIVSPTDRMSDVTRKVADYIDAGTRLVWIIDPVTRTAAVHRSRSDVKMLRDSDTLDGGDVLPGFRLPLAELLDG